MALKVNEYNFQHEVLNSKKPVLVDFGAEWCQPCKRLNPILKELDIQWDGQIQIAEVDADESGNLVMQMQVMSLPTMILFVDGKETSRIVGFQTPEKINEKISSLVGMTLP